MVDTLLHQPDSAKGSRELSERQREVLQLLGVILKITARTVAFHKYTFVTMAIA